MISEVMAAGLEIFEEEEGTKQLDGRIFLFTGTLSSMSRNEAKQRVKSLGGQVSSSLSSKVTDLVAGDKPGSKLAKAQDTGVRILGEEQFISLLWSQEEKV